MAAKDIAVLNCLGGAGPEDELIRCVAVSQHPTADLAVIETKGMVPDSFEKFKLSDRDYGLGTPVHCFGILDEWMASQDSERGHGRVIGGIIQRDLLWRDGPFVSMALEYSAPIPKGMSGGPAFYARQPDTVLGMAIGTITSSIVVSEYRDYKNDQTHEIEKISEITRYGVILRLFPYQKRLQDNIPSR